MSFDGYINHYNGLVNQVDFVEVFCYSDVELANFRAAVTFIQMSPTELGQGGLGKMEAGPRDSLRCERPPVIHPYVALLSSRYGHTEIYVRDA